MNGWLGRKTTEGLNDSLPTAAVAIGFLRK